MEELDLGQTIRGFSAGQKLFERYVLQSILGRGGMGVVWRAYDAQLECEVALKFLPEMVAFDEQAIADLKRETKKTRDLRHHHIVQVYDFVTDKHAACISMEYVDGLTLSAIKARDPRGHLEVDEISTWVEQLCEALSYAHHRARVVHRDLKPANLMLNSRGELKVTDFGIARSLSDSVSMATMGRGTSGTLVYMSPQQAIGNGATALDDIYSLGATLYDLLTGKPPFYTGNIVHQVETVVPPPMNERRAELGARGLPIPATWEAVVAACLEKDPALRPQGAMDVAWRLGLVKNYVPAPERPAAIPARPPSPVEQSVPMPGRPRSHRHRRLSQLVTAAALLLLASAGVAGWWFGIEQPRREAERERKPMEQKEKDQRDYAAARQPEIAELERPTTQPRAKEEEATKKKQRDYAAARRLEIAELERLTAEPRAKEEETTKKEQREYAAARRLEIAELARLTAQPRAKEEATKKEHSPRTDAGATREQPFVNSLGMKFVPVAGTAALVSTWETRVRDFQAFVDATGYNAEEGMFSLENGEIKQARRTWKSPGFEQTGEHAVCGVSYEDATAFGEWLTKEERKTGRINAKQKYRLPTDLEWSAAVGLKSESGSTPGERAREGHAKLQGVYPWGTIWPPPVGAGNYAGSEALTGGWPSNSRTIEGYRDDYPRTSPVGSFAPNGSGIYDLGGNVWEWCQDWINDTKIHRVLRGAAWISGASPDELLSSHRSGSTRGRISGYGFRCVLVVESSR